MAGPDRRRSRRVWRKHGRAFIRWLDSEEVVVKRLDDLAQALEQFLGQRLARVSAQRDFVEAIPRALTRCDDVASYGTPMFIEAYAYLHLLERYRRFWDVYRMLVQALAMPLRRWPVDVLDVGTGPAPSLYALADFYDAVRAYGSLAGVVEFAQCATPPDWMAVELSAEMNRFVHHFSEIAGRSGPFGARFPDFDQVDLHAARTRLREQELDALIEELGSEQAARRVLNDEGEIDHEYRLDFAIFSNFLTTERAVAARSSRLRGVFNEVRSGGLVIVVGATEAQYPAIYETVGAIAETAAIRRLSEVPGSIQCDYGSPQAERIRDTLTAVWEGLRPSVRAKAQDVPPIILDRSAVQTTPRAFGLAVWRRGRWRSRAPLPEQAAM